MKCNKCCFCIPHTYGSYIIGAIFLTFNVVWGPVVMAPILMAGTLVSVLLIYGAAKRKRIFILLWLITYLAILLAYIVLYIITFVTDSPPPIIIGVQTVIIIALIYSLLMVHAFYRYLSTEEYDDAI